MNTPPPLIELLGARWAFDVPVVGLAWDNGAKTFGFGLGDGHVALVDTAWPDGPKIQMRSDGAGMEVLPPKGPPSMPKRVAAHGETGACLSLVGVAEEGGGFLSGGDDGRLVHVRSDGSQRTVAEHSGRWIDQVASAVSGWRAYAMGRRVCRQSPQPGAAVEQWELPSSVTALAFDPAGKKLAMAHHGGVTIWPNEGEPTQLSWPGYHRALSWSPDGQYLMSGMQENALHGWRIADAGDIEMGGYPGQPRSLSFSGDGRFLATSGAPRVTCWRFDPPGQDSQPTECGIPSKTPVTVVACHPRHPLIAAGYHNGAVLLTQPGKSEVLFVKGSGGGAVSALAWSTDGASLALGTEGGEIAWVNLPGTLFRFDNKC